MSGTRSIESRQLYRAVPDAVTELGPEKAWRLNDAYALCGLLVPRAWCKLKPELGVRGNIDGVTSRRVRLRKYSLRMHRRTDCPADLPLPRLPTRQRERSCANNVFCGRQISIFEVNANFS